MTWDDVEDWVAYLTLKNEREQRDIEDAKRRAQAEAKGRRR